MLGFALVLAARLHHLALVRYAMVRRPVLLLSLLAVVTALSGCPKSTPKYATVADARKAILEARDEAKAARDAKDAAKALAAAARAKDALAQAEALQGPRTTTEPAPDPLADVRKAAREARDLGQETDERVRLAAQLSGLKASLYRGARGVAVSGFFQGLGLAAQQADARGLAALPAPVQSNALVAAHWAEQSLGRKPLADGSPDWKGIAKDMETFAGAPPADLGITLAVGFCVIGKTGLALIEAEAVDPTTEKDPVKRLPLHLVRAFARNGNGYRRLAILEVEEGMAAARVPTGEDAPVVAGVTVTGAEVVGGMHLLLGAFYLHEKDLAAADREAALALQAWPENPVGEFITGERLLASGEREKAAACVESAARGQGKDAEWLAADLAARARAIRDGEASADDGLLGDPTFLAKVGLVALWRAAERSPEAAAAKARVQRAQDAANDLLSRVPGLGSGEGDVAPVTSTGR